MFLWKEYGEAEYNPKWSEDSDCIISLFHSIQIRQSAIDFVQFRYVDRQIFELKNCEKACWDFVLNKKRVGDRELSKCLQANRYHANIYLGCL